MKSSNSPSQFNKYFHSKNLIFIAFVIIIALIILLILTFLTPSPEAKPKITTNLIENQIQEAKELTTTKYIYTNAGVFENQNNFYGVNIPFTNKSFIVVYDGTIHTGIDLDEVSVSIDDKTISVEVPEAKILSHDLDAESLKVLNESSTFLNPIKVDDYKSFTIEQEKSVETQAIERGLLIEASEHAKDAIISVLNMNPLIDEEGYVIIVK